MSHYTYPPPVPFPPLYGSVQPYDYSADVSSAPPPPAQPVQLDDVVRQYVNNAVKEAMVVHRNHTTEWFTRLNAQYTSSTEARLKEVEAKMLKMETRMRAAELRLTTLPAELKVDVDKRLEDALQEKVREVESWLDQQVDAAEERLRDILRSASERQIVRLGEKAKDELGKHVYELGRGMGKETRSFTDEIDRRLNGKITALESEVETWKRGDDENEAYLACQQLEERMVAAKSELEARLDVLDIYFTQRLDAILSQLPDPQSEPTGSNNDPTPGSHDPPPICAKPRHGSGETQSGVDESRLHSSWEVSEDRYIAALGDLKLAVEERLQSLESRCVKLERSVRKRENHSRGDGMTSQYEEIPAPDGTCPSDWMFDDLPFPPLRHVSDIERLSDEQLLYALQRYGCDHIPYIYTERKRLLLKEIGSSLG
ncbi:hypothetical protein K466DRAFT_627347 [Polyporus arcularius HHB13444]|uniref:Mug135-like C-terminal domain-containing protein n=1 Tax=Polyporus arcularius HHB13444 TaxID=1314778 RepID=A0A5C3P3H8_9APHY|nr:hypothetical protein K466DRAFT_627347 [Polyporus arcularius HHB13444]